jgi:trigger factor
MDPTPMKADLVDVNETRKNLKIEIPSDVVDRQIERVTRSYSQRARVPGFRPGKAPSRVIKLRFKEQILSDVAHELVPRAVDEALRERGVEPVDTPDVHDVSVEEGQALTFTASFDTLPSFDVGDYSTLALRQRSGHVEDEAVSQALERLRLRAARFEPVEDRAIVDTDFVVVDLERTDAAGKTEKRQEVTVELGGKANPPGFDQQLLGLVGGATKAFSIQYPSDYPIGELAGTSVSYTVTVKGIKRRVLPELDDELAKDLGEFETFEALRARVREDLEHEARHLAAQETRGDLMKQLAARVPYEMPASLIERELDRRIEDFARRLVEQRIDPRQAGIDWNAFRDSQRLVAREAVAGALVLDEVARREHLDVTEAEADQEIARYAERNGRAVAAVRAALEKEGGLSTVYAGLRRDKAVDFLMARATISRE